VTAAALQDLLPDCAVPALTITGLTEDSRAVQPGDAFVAVRGAAADGHNHIAEAVANGALAVLCEEPAADACVPAIVVPELKSRRGEIARRLYADPSAELRCFGVTGTNGKTSIAHFIAQLGNALGNRCGYLGTIGWGVLENLQPARLTTVDAISLQQRLRDLLDQGCDWAALEVSSHALSQGRVDDVGFDVAIFSNLSRDHLDYHSSIEEYGAAKARLFTFAGLSHAIVNADDDYAVELSAVMAEDLDVITYGRTGAVSWSDLSFDAAGVTGRWCSPWGTAPLNLGLAGEFSVANMAAALAAACCMGHDFDDAVAATRDVAGVPGRMEFFSAPGSPAVVVDYAHTPDALDKALAAARRHTAGRLLCVFGCGGDRDPGKRPLMARAAAGQADELWLTSDNPRSEDPAKIIRDMRAGLTGSSDAHSCVDRREAIAAALAAAGPGDLLMVAGRGHETHQEVAGQLLELSDRAVVAQLLGVAG
jgi:UDP-N-acetylmuramoyl-L-alanyl-D-glutamate--2,6-diaminopimelate ligase